MVALLRVALLVRWSAGVLCALLCLQLVAPSHAAESVNVAVGGYQGYRDLALGWDLGKIWSHDGRSRQELVPEVSVGYSDYDGHVAASRNRLWHVGGEFLYRWYCAPRTFLEAGAGPNLFTRTLVGNHVLSTNLQFGDSIGFAHEVSDRWTLGLRVVHFSNAGIKRPNDGVSFVNIVASYRFGPRRDH